MTAANAIDWRDRLAHASRRRLGEAVVGLLRHVTGQEYTVDRVGGSGNGRMSYWVGRPRADGRGRVRQECVLEARPELQGGDQLAWEATLTPLAERDPPRVLGQVVWEPDCAPQYSEYRFRPLPRSDPAFGRPDTGRGAGTDARTGGQRPPVGFSVPRREAEDVNLVIGDDRAGHVLGAGAVQVVLGAAYPVRPSVAWVREFLRRFEHFHMLLPGDRVTVYRALGEVARVNDLEGREAADALTRPLVEYLDRRLPLSVHHIENWLLGVMADADQFDGGDASDPAARTRALEALLARANRNEGMTERLTYGVGCYTRAALRAERHRRFGSNEGPTNPCAEIVLPGGYQEDRISRWAAEARARQEAARDRDVMSTAAAEAARQQRAEANDRFWGGFICPPAQVTQEVPEPQQPPEITAGTPLTVGPDGLVRPARPGEAHLFVAAGPVREDGRVEAMGVSGSSMVLPLVAPPEGERIRGLRSNTIIVDEVQDIDPAAADELIAATLAPNGPTAGVTSDLTSGADGQVLQASGGEIGFASLADLIQNHGGGSGFLGTTVAAADTPDRLSPANGSAGNFAQTTLEESFNTIQQALGGSTDEAVAGTLTRATLQDGLDAIRRHSARHTGPVDGDRRQARQDELINQMRQVVSQMFDPDLDDSRMTGEQVTLAHLRYRLRVLLNIVPIGRLMVSEIFEDDTVLDFEVRERGTGRVLSRVRMDDPENLGPAARRIGGCEEAAAAPGARAIDL